MSRASTWMMFGALLAACASSQPEPQQTTPSTGASGGQMMGRQEMRSMCPMMVEGTTHRYERVEDGAAIVFTTTGDEEDLRNRVSRMADMHNRHRSMHDGMGGRRMMMMMTTASARAEPIEGGARIVFTPDDPEQLSSLRAQVQQHAERMSAGECPMMSMMGQRKR